MKKRKRIGDSAAGARTPAERVAHFPSRRRFLEAGAALCLFGALLGPGLLAKQKPMPVKTILGAVLTSSNAGVPGASVMLTNVEEHYTHAMYAGANGKYNFSGLNPNDDYEVRAKYKNLVSNVRHVSSLDSRSQVVINLVLHAPAAASSADSR